MSQRADTVNTLCQLLSDGDEADRCYAARALAVIRSSEAVPPLVGCLRDEDIDVCVDAADALGSIGDPQAVAPLLEVLANDPEGEVCCAAVRALGQLGGESAVKALMTIAIERPESIEWAGDWDPWWDVQREAVKALGSLKDPQAVPILIAILEDESQQDIESELLHALAVNGELGSSHLAERITDSSLRTQQRRRAVHAMGYSTLEQAAKPLGRALQDQEHEVRAEAIQALAKLGAGRYLGAILLMLRDSSDQVRQAAISACTTLADADTGDDNLRRQMLPLLEDPSPLVRVHLYRLLAGLATPPQLTEARLSELVEALNAEEAECAAAAAVLLSTQQGDQVPEALIQVLVRRSANPMVRREAALALARVGRLEESAIEQIAEQLHDPEQPVRLASINALLMLQEETDLAVENRPLQRIIDLVLNQRTADPQPEGPPELPDNASQSIDLSAEALRSDPGAEATPEPQLDLPESRARIVREGEVRSAGSTLDAIAMDNVEIALGVNQPAEQEAPDEETLEYLDVVENNKEQMRRIRSERKIPLELDVRRLGARLLADHPSEPVVQALLQLLNDDDALLRREAALAVARIAANAPDTQGLNDVLGTLVTQLTVGDEDMRLACAQALGALGNRAAQLPLAQALENDQPQVQIAAIQALVQLALEGRNPAQADDMVVRELPPTSLARRLANCFDIESIGVRLAAIQGLARIRQLVDQGIILRQALQKAVDSVERWTGEEARLVGRELSAFNPDLVEPLLLEKISSASNSTERSIHIEMLEEMLNSNRPAPGQAA